MLIDANELQKAFSRPENRQGTRGPYPAKRLRVAQEMRREIKVGSVTVEGLRSFKQKDLAERYRCSRQTARDAFALLSEFETPTNSDTK